MLGEVLLDGLGTDPSVGAKIVMEIQAQDRDVPNKQTPQNNPNQTERNWVGGSEKKAVPATDR
jgi:hypothetical protein